MYCSEDASCVQRAAHELENLRTNNAMGKDGAPFPRNCKRLLYQITGNSRCVDCGNSNPSWASVTYGVLLCVNCSGRHRSYGVKYSRVRSIDMDAWSHSQVLALLEGGNHQMKQFFVRHQMTGKSVDALDHQYRTKAARFYKTQLEQHVTAIAEQGIYSGREASRKRSQSPKNNRTSSEARNESNTVMSTRTRSPIAVQ